MPVRDELVREILAELREWRGDAGRGGRTRRWRKGEAKRAS